MWPLVSFCLYGPDISFHFSRPAGQTSTADQLARPARRTSTADQHGRPTRQTHTTAILAQASLAACGPPRGSTRGQRPMGAASHCPWTAARARTLARKLRRQRLEGAAGDADLEAPHHCRRPERDSPLLDPDLFFISDWQQVFSRCPFMLRGRGRPTLCFGNVVDRFRFLFVFVSLS